MAKVRLHAHQGVYVDTPRSYAPPSWRSSDAHAGRYVPTGQVCYFVTRDERIKIGTTINLRKRLITLGIPVSGLLAWEPGDRHREAELHRQFDHLALGHEWFRPGPDLLAYVLDLIE